MTCLNSPIWSSSLGHDGAVGAFERTGGEKQKHWDQQRQKRFAVSRTLPCTKDKKSNVTACLYLCVSLDKGVQPSPPPEPSLKLRPQSTAEWGHEGFWSDWRWCLHEGMERWQKHNVMSIKWVQVMDSEHNLLYNSMKSRFSLSSLHAVMSFPQCVCLLLLC